MPWIWMQKPSNLTTIFVASKCWRCEKKKYSTWIFINRLIKSKICDFSWKATWLGRQFIQLSKTVSTRSDCIHFAHIYRNYDCHSASPALQYDLRWNLYLRSRIVCIPRCIRFSFTCLLAWRSCVGNESSLVLFVCLFFFFGSLYGIWFGFWFRLCVKVSWKCCLTVYKKTNIKHNNI